MKSRHILTTTLYADVGLLSPPSWRVVLQIVKILEIEDLDHTMSHEKQPKRGKFIKAGSWIVYCRQGRRPSMR